MDKSGSIGNVAKNIVAAPDYPLVKQVEYGCGKCMAREKRQGLTSPQSIYRSWQAKIQKV